MNSLTTAPNPERKGSKRRQKRQQEYSRWLTDARMKAGLTQQEVATEIGAKNTQISRYERGINLPSRDTVLQLAKVLDADPAEALQVAGHELQSPLPKGSHSASPDAPPLSESPLILDVLKNAQHGFPPTDTSHHETPLAAPVQIAIANDLVTRADMRRIQVNLEERFFRLEERLSKIMEAVCEVVKMVDPSETGTTSDAKILQDPVLELRYEVFSKIESLTEFQEDLKQAFGEACRQSSSLSLMLIDVDNLKSYNMEYGHHLGDKVLRIVAHLLEETARPTDTVARLLEERSFDWGNRYGDQYALLMPGTNAEQAHWVEQEYRRKIAEFPWGHRGVTVSTSVVTRTAKMITGNELLQRAAEELDTKREKARGEETKSQHR